MIKNVIVFAPHLDLFRNCNLSYYPDMQPIVTLDLDNLDLKLAVKIACSITNANDLICFQCIVAALKRNDFDIDCIDLKYLWGGRADRVFSPGTCNFLMDIIEPVIPDNTRMRMLDAHSFRWKQYTVKNYYAFDELINELTAQNITELSVVYPDKNAADKYYNCIGLLGQYTIGDLVFNKTRMDGDFILTVNTEKSSLVSKNKPLLIIDDLCDGGGTFIALAQKLDELGYTGNKYLYVTHGLFSKGFTALFNHYEHIYTTNSVFSGIEGFEGWITVIDVFEGYR